jgi:hypothetical protein
MDHWFPGTWMEDCSRSFCAVVCAQIPQRLKTHASRRRKISAGKPWETLVVDSKTPAKPWFPVGCFFNPRTDIYIYIDRYRYSYIHISHIDSKGLKCQVQEYDVMTWSPAIVLTTSRPLVRWFYWLWLQPPAHLSLIFGDVLRQCNWNSPWMKLPG